MVYSSITLMLRPRSRPATAQTLKELAIAVFNEKGVIRRLSNEGIMRPYRRFRDTNTGVVHFVRYVQLHVDMSDAGRTKLHKMITDHPDVVGHLIQPLETAQGLYATKDFMALDLFARPEEEIMWPPQASQDVYEQLDMNWKEFSRTRWSNFLRE